MRMTDQGLAETDRKTSFQDQFSKDLQAESISDAF